MKQVLHQWKVSPQGILGIFQLITYCIIGSSRSLSVTVFRGIPNT